MENVLQSEQSCCPPNVKTLLNNQQRVTHNACRYSCQLCVTAHDFTQRSALHNHLEDVHHLYGQEATEILDMLCNIAEANAAEFD